MFDDHRDAAEPAAAEGDTARASQRFWLEIRRYLTKNRQALTLAAVRLYTGLASVAGTPLLASGGWLPSRPLPLEAVTVVWDPVAAPPTVVDGTTADLLPLRTPTERFGTYADTIAALDRPSVFSNRPCYRLLAIETLPDATVRATFGSGLYFDGINTGEAVAHEFAAAVFAVAGPADLDRTPGTAVRVASGHDLPLRSAIGDPRDLTRRPAQPAVSVLTIRRDPVGGARILLHWRDPAKVATNNGLFQVIPVGVFQPSAPGEANRVADFDLERFIVREMSEELLGTAESHGDSGAVLDYDGWPFHQRWTAARRDGTLRLHWCGAGVDPLTLSTDMLVVAVIDAEPFDDLFGGLVAVNDEGDVVGAGVPAGRVGVAFTADTVLRYSTVEPMQPAGAALLRLAWQHRATLLAP